MNRFHVDQDIASARTIHTDMYTSAEVFELCKEKIFASTWQFITDESKLRDKGSCYPFTFMEGYMDEPLLVTKDENGQVHCLSNVCTHRGNILIDEGCKTANLRCKYHGRLFKLDGSFHSMPEFKEVKDFPSEEDNLHRLPLHQWSKFLFTLLAAGVYIRDMKPFEVILAVQCPVCLNNWKTKPSFRKYKREYAHAFITTDAILLQGKRVPIISIDY